MKTNHDQAVPSYLGTAVFARDTQVTKPISLALVSLVSQAKTHVLACMKDVVVMEWAKNTKFLLPRLKEYSFFLGTGGTLGTEIDNQLVMKQFARDRARDMLGTALKFAQARLS